MMDMNEALAQSIQATETTLKSIQQKQEDQWKAFHMMWLSILYAPTKEIYFERLFEFEQKFQGYNQQVHYIKNTWLKHKDKLVTAWIDELPHFGNTVTSRVEGIHSVIKKYLTTNSGNFLILVQTLQDVITHQLRELDIKQNKEQFKRLISCQTSFY